MLSDEQLNITNNLIDWFYCNRKKQAYTTVGGYAGTGKTFLIGNLKSEILKNLNHLKDLRFAYCAFTGKASSVLKTKLEEFEHFNKDIDFVGTIHRLIYVPEYSKDPDTGKTVISKWRKLDYLAYDLIIVDEASMVNKQLWKDLLSYKIPIIAVGDHGQLPPVGEEDSNLMTSPNYVLKTIHRQALDSPIIKLSVNVRNNGFIPYGVYDKKVIKSDWSNEGCKNIFKQIQWNEDVICLCGFNATRVKLNNYIREKKLFTQPDPYPGERIICLKNNYDTKIMNGQIATISWMVMFNKDIYCIDMKVDGTDSVYSNLVHSHCFGKEAYNDSFDIIAPKKIKRLLNKSGYNSVDLFDFGYAISVHKSQGSEFQKIVLFEQRSKHWDDNYYMKWLYTGVTRAKEKLFIISGFY